MLDAIRDLYSLPSASPVPGDTPEAAEAVLTVDELEPDDYDGSEDGDDSVHAGLRPEYQEEGEALAAAGTFVATRPPKRAVLFGRELRQGKSGKDVVALKRALSKAGYVKWQSRWTRLFGPYTATALKKFQREHGLRADGVYGPATHAKLAPYYDAYGAALLGQFPRAPVGHTVVTAALFGYHVRGSIHYTQSALRMYGVRNKIRPPAIPKWEDCSSYATWTYWLAKRRDPNGRGYDGYGFTGTLAANGRPAAPAAGRLSFYGRYPHTHVTIDVSASMCVSHGSERGPVLVPIRYRRDYSHTRSY
jgi:hypothetical protein